LGCPQIDLWNLFHSAQDQPQYLTSGIKITMSRPMFLFEQFFASQRHMNETRIFFHSLDFFLNRHFFKKLKFEKKWPYLDTFSDLTTISYIMFQLFVIFGIDF
jgi:hypothetical protein